MQALIIHLVQQTVDKMSPGTWEKAAASTGLPLRSASSEELDDATIQATLTAVAQALQRPLPELLQEAGHAAVPALARSHLGIFEHFDHPFDLLGALEPLVHASIRTTGKTPPTFGFVRKTPTHGVLRYESERRMGHLAVGMTRGVLDWYKVDAEVRCEDADGARADIHIHLASTQ